ncbi:mediator of RNA polymerase II transcription subunit 16-like isoform X2 [Gigantopelta aegis]|nr:mediator of RNA polymerase II transcription subunit 16-like isoform X2 [Gigantopelta aegis]XP_041359312.1 mediator of RNA polymerase II transcription subunit 16-like isoform X2 [Gigantopelta aegis]
MNPISHIVWDPSGSKLLIVDCEGMFEVWHMEAHLVNKWSVLYKRFVKGEEVLALAWIHNGLQIPFNPDKRECILFGEKFPRAKFSPTMAHFGSKSLDGWVAVTATGLICVGLIFDREKQLITAEENLAPFHLRLSEADISFASSGEILVATSDGLMSSTIQCFTVRISLQQGQCAVQCEASASLYMKSQMDYNGTNNDDGSQALHITNLSFMNHESSDTLLVACGGQGYSCIEVWQLVDQALSLHRMFQKQQTGQEVAYKTPRWVHTTTITHNSILTGIAKPIIPLARSSADPLGFVSYFAAAYKDGSIKVMNRYSYQVIFACNLDSLVGVHHIPNLDMEKVSRVPYLSTVVQTWTGSGLVGISGSRAFVFQVVNTRDGPIQLMPGALVHLLEYIVNTGNDWWDVLLIISPGMIDRICRRLSEDFQKQPISMQELMRVRLIRLKIGLYSCVPGGHQKAADCHAKLSLYAISSVLKGMLRPKVVAATDKSPSEKLSNICTTHLDTDLDSVLANLDTDEFIMEVIKKEKCTETTLQSLQPFTQWVTDFALHLLSAIPLYRTYSGFRGASLLKDELILTTLRELVIIIRIWGLINPACLPHFSSTSHVDVLAIIYKLLTRVWLYCQDGGSLEYDEGLMDECCELPNKLSVPNMKQSYGEENCSYAIFGQDFPQMFSLGVEPDFLSETKRERCMYMPDGIVETTQKHDAIRHIHLGSRSLNGVRECCRCGALSLANMTAKTTTMKSWEQRFVKTCMCGGLWKLCNT